MVRSEIERAAIACDRSGEIAPRLMDIAEVAVRFGIVGPKPEGLVQLLLGRGEAPEIGEDDCEIVAELGGSRLQSEGAAEGGERLLGAALLVEGYAEIVMRGGKIRIEPKRASVACNLLVTAVERAQREAEIVMRRRRLGIDRDGLADERDGGGEIARLGAQSAEEMQRLEIVRLALEDLAAERGRGRRIAALLRRDRLRQRLAYRLAHGMTAAPLALGRGC